MVNPIKIPAVLITKVNFTKIISYVAAQAICGVINLVTIFNLDIYAAIQSVNSVTLSVT